MDLYGLLNLLISNITQADIEIIKEIADIVPKSSASYYADMFNFILSYHKDNKEFPSPEFLQTQFAGIWVRVNGALTKEAINILLSELRKDSATMMAYSALQNKDLELAKQILEKGAVKAEFTETKATEICEIYDAMNDLPEGLQIGVPELDAVYKNFSYGTNNFIAAPQKSGKTTAAISLSYDGLMRRNMNVVYLTLEVKPFDIYANFFARHAHEIGAELNAQKVKKNLLDDEEREVLEKVQRSFTDIMEHNENHLAVIANHDLPEMTQSYFKQFLETKYEEWGRIDLVVIDHIGLTGFYPIKGISDMKERINSWIKFTTDLAKGFHEKGFILISLMQVNRQGTLLMKKGKSIGFDVLADANEAERSCHTCTVMYSTPEFLLANKVKLYCLANRNGPPLTSDEEDNSIEAYLNPKIYQLGHKKASDTINIKNKDLLKPLEDDDEELPTSLFSSMI